MKKKINKIIVGISGGVDSSVTALLLKEQGYHVEALFMKNWDDKEEKGRCLWEADVEDAMRVCDKLNIPLNTVDLSSEYWDRVFRDFVNEYKNGLTPNPDVVCNQEIKFKAFLEHAKDLGANKIATGHYARISFKNEAYQLLKGSDTQKDQSYFLCRLNQLQLKNTLFPIGGLKKTQVRNKAKEAGLITHNKKDSTGICFIGEQPFRQFLSRFIPPQTGLIKTTEGKTIGEHHGCFYYTLGQRQGLGIGGVCGAKNAPWYIVKKDIEKNQLVVTQDHDHPLLYSRELIASKVHWISNSPPNMPFKCLAKNRYRQNDQSCLVKHVVDDKYSVIFDSAQRAITPGQFIVFYLGDVCLGSGVIYSAH